VKPSADLDGDLAIRDGIGVFQPQGAALIEVRVVSVDEETVVQLNNIGPWVITYIDPRTTRARSEGHNRRGKGYQVTQGGQTND
jgi:hypothetical protein